MKQAKPGRRLLDGEATLPKQSGWAADSDQLENACVLYEELVGTRDRIADLGAINPKDMETVARALYEVVGYLLTPPPRAKTELRLPQATKHELAAAARSRKIETFVFAVALVALKLGKRENAAVTVAHQLAIIGDALDSISFDYRTPKRSILTTLRRLFITTVVRQAVRQNREAGPIFSKGLCSSRRARTDSSRHSARRSQVL
jgi:hypothetical protein